MKPDGAAGFAVISLMRRRRRWTSAQKLALIQEIEVRVLTPAAGVRIHLALGTTDMRRGFDGLSAQVQQVLREDPFLGTCSCSVESATT